MSENETESKVYGTRISGEFKERLDVYLEDSEGSTSENLKTLLRLGLEVEGAERSPGELQREVNVLREAAGRLRGAIEELEEDRENLKQSRLAYKVSSHLMFWGISVFFFLIGLRPRIEDILGGLPLWYDNIVGLGGALLLGLGMLVFIGILVTPVFERLDTLLQRMWGQIVE
jgi:hypothetical protein